MRTSLLVGVLASLLAVACWNDSPRGAAPPTAASNPKRTADGIVLVAPGSLHEEAGAPTAPAEAGTPPATRVVGTKGIAAWDALPPSEKKRVTTDISSFFLHQSVGGDLEDGAEAVGFKFEWATSDSTSLAPGLNGGLFTTSNGNPSGKIAEFRRLSLANRSSLKVAIMKFGYADVVAGTLATAKAEYQAAVAAVKAAGVRVLHVTPPLVYAAPGENAPKMQMRSWMTTTFPTDVVFDLQDLESVDPVTGSRCTRDGSWEICSGVRSTTACPSLNQGIDAPSGQGHLCFKPHAQRFAKAFLYAIHLSGT